MKIFQTDPSGEPLAKKFERHDLVRRTQGFPFLVGDSGQRMILDPFQPGFREHCVRARLGDDAVFNKITEHLSQGQPMFHMPLAGGNACLFDHK